MGAIRLLQETALNLLSRFWGYWLDAGLHSIRSETPEDQQRRVRRYRVAAIS